MPPSLGKSEQKVPNCPLIPPCCIFTQYKKQCSEATSPKAIENQRIQPLKPIKTPLKEENKSKPTPPYDQKFKTLKTP